ncbi:MULTISPECIES: iron chelate uptake ABC transporter family permease subunit [unclassified Peribacillus]|uniref:iron chelate uptake ABC transporter family permease subunit n=1 Tax=unclassified Peribacillus TaxID=2675266 RepID=UPI0025B661B5|nr:iron chelate uptake ABC transporter family permease subunit [Peribacillus sp. Bi96]
MESTFTAYPVLHLKALFPLHAARRMVGFEHKKVIPVSLFLGGILLTSADFIGRLVLAPKEIPS